MSCDEDVAVDVQDVAGGGGREEEAGRLVRMSAAQPPAPGQLLPWLLVGAQWGRDAAPVEGDALDARADAPQLGA